MIGERLNRLEWTVMPIHDHAQAEDFVRRNHYSKSAPNTSTYRHGLYRSFDCLRGELMGVALWIPPTKAAALTLTPRWESVLCLSRLCVREDCPRNAASFLLSGSMRLIDRPRWPILLTYADTGEGHTGAIYRATNWRELGPVPAGDVWIGPNGEQRGRKRGGRTLRRADMESLGFRQKPASPKIKFIHEVTL